MYIVSPGVMREQRKAWGKLIVLVMFTEAGNDIVNGSARNELPPNCKVCNASQGLGGALHAAPTLEYE